MSNTAELQKQDLAPGGYPISTPVSTVSTISTPGSSTLLPVSTPRPQKSLRTPDFSEIGKTGLKRFSGRVYEEFLVNLRGLQGVRTYREMADNDEIVGASLYALERVLSSASWSVEPYDNTTECLKDADFIKECMSDMEHSWSDFILEANSALVYGWCICEEVYKLRKGDNVDKRIDSKFNDGRIGWRKFSRRLQSTWFQWDLDEKGDILGMVQNPPPDYGFYYIPIDKSAYFRTQLNGNNPEGRSILRNAYKSYYFKKQIQMLEAIGIERDLVRIPQIIPPEGFDIADPTNANVLEYVRNILANLRRDEQEGIFLPPGWTIELLSTSNSRRQFDLDKIINRYDKRIAITMLAQFIMLGMDRVGSFALSSNQNDLFKLAVQSYLNRMAETINTFSIPRLFRMNPELGKGNKLPRIIPANVAAPSLTELATYINALGKNALLPEDSKALISSLMRTGRFFEANEYRLGDIYSNKISDKITGKTYSGSTKVKTVPKTVAVKENEQE
jgi:hypothetical protein